MCYGLATIQPHTGHKYTVFRQIIFMTKSMNVVYRKIRESWNNLPGGAAAIILIFFSVLYSVQCQCTFKFCTLYNLHLNSVQCTSRFAWCSLSFYCTQLGLAELEAGLVLQINQSLQCTFTRLYFFHLRDRAVIYALVLALDPRKLSRWNVKS